MVGCTLSVRTNIDDCVFCLGGSAPTRPFMGLPWHPRTSVYSTDAQPTFIVISSHCELHCELVAATSL